MTGNNTQLFLDTLRSLQHTLLSAAAQIDVILALAERSADEVQEPIACQHPMAYRISMRSMGHPTRYKCMKCKQEVEG